MCVCVGRRGCSDEVLTTSAPAARCMISVTYVMLDIHDIIYLQFTNINICNIFSFASFYCKPAQHIFNFKHI